MENEYFAKFKTFASEQLAMDLAEVLKKNKISYQVSSTPSTDILFSNNKFGKEYTIKVRKDDFEKANQVLLQISKQEADQIDDGYYLYSFTDEELYEIISKPDDWSLLDGIIAAKILKQRGKVFDLAKLKEERLVELSKPEPNSDSFIIFGYLISLLGGVFAIFIGWNLMTFKKTLPNGEKIYGYSQEDREHGKRIFNLGVILAIAIALAIILGNYFQGKHN